MVYKNKQDKKIYMDKYYHSHQMQFAYNKRLNYWRKKALSLGEPQSIVSELSLGDLQELCKEHTGE